MGTPDCYRNPSDLASAWMVSTGVVPSADMALAAISSVIIIALFVGTCGFMGGHLYHTSWYNRCRYGRGPAYRLNNCAYYKKAASPEQTMSPLFLRRLRGWSGLR
jgi:hypothetical protein